MTLPGPSIQSSGSHGLHSATWKQIRKALGVLGGCLHRTTVKEGTVIIEMPSGYRIGVGQRGSNDVPRQEGLKRIMDQVVEARLEPVLFLAVLSEMGASWFNKPAVVSQLQRYLKREKPPLDTVERWRAALVGFAAWMDAQQEGESVPEDQVEERPEYEYGYKLRDALELAGVSADRYGTVYKRMVDQLRAETGEMFEVLVRDGNLLVRELGQRRMYHLTEAGVLTVATYITKTEDALGFPPDKPEEVVDEENEPAVANEAQALAKQASRPTPGQAALLLAQEAEVDVPWREDDPTAIDVNELLVRLAEAL